MTVGDLVGALIAFALTFAALSIGQSHPLIMGGVFGVGAWLEYKFGFSLGRHTGQREMADYAGKMIEDAGLAEPFRAHALNYIQAKAANGSKS